MRNATTLPAERQELGENVTPPVEIDSRNSSSVGTFSALRVTFSQCDSVYEGDLHWAIIEVRPCGTILADVDVGSESLALATLFAASPDLLTAAVLAIAEIERSQKIIGLTKDDHSEITLAALRSAVDKSHVQS